MRFIYILCFIVIANLSQARWASFDLAPTRTDIYNHEIKINKNGTYEEIKEEEFEILKESGRDSAAHYTIYYNSDSEKIKILDAKTIYKGKEYKINKKFIEDKPLASAANGFDQTNQILLAFPKTEIGAKIYIKYQKTTFKAALNNFFSDLFSFGIGRWTKNSHIKIKSELPLYIKVNDPEQILDIKTDKDKAFHNLSITLNKETYKEVVNEPQNIVENFDLLTWVSVSSANNWEEISRTFAKQNFDKIHSQDLPKEFIEIKNAALKETTEIDQINIVTSMLNDKIQYMTDRRTIDGRIMPRDLSQIVKSQLGDCKDLSASTIAILKSMGYKAQFALVRRGETNLTPNLLPTPQVFNHVIVKVTGKDGNIYWIDPTNIQSMANGIFPDIANKPTLIIDSDQPTYEIIPNIHPHHAQAIHERIIAIADENKILEQGTLKLTNEEAFPLTGTTLLTSKDNVQDYILSQLSGTNSDSTDKKYIELPDLSSRIVKDIVINYMYEQENRLSKTNLGLALKLKYNKMDDFIFTSQDMVSNIFIGTPSTSKRKTVIKYIDIQNEQSLNKEIDTKWLKISRELSLKKKTLTINETMIIKQGIITNKELRSPAFINLKKDLEIYFKDISIVFN